MSSRMKTVEQRVDKFEDSQQQMDNKQELQVANQVKVNSEFEERLRKLELNSGTGTIREVDDRMDKSYNLLVYSVPESNSGDPKDRAEHDAAMIEAIMGRHLSIEGMNTENKVKFVRRLGARGEREDLRPILLGLKFTADIELVLDRTWMLSRSSSKAAQEINIVRDLTVRQRQKEADMVKDALKKNIERSTEEQDLNLVYKVVGRRGERREIRVPLRQGEILDRQGRVIREDGRDSGSNRRSTASRPLATGANSEPIGAAKVPDTAVPQNTTANNIANAKDNIVVENKGEENASKVDNKVSGDGWQPAVGKRGRASPSPDKVLKKSRGGAVAVLEIRNRFQRMAQEIFRGEEE